MTKQNWPDPKRPGVPMFPERDGWHVLENKYHDGEEYWWDAELYYWTTVPDGDLIWVPDEAVKDFTYKRICLTPTQINEMLAAERERCAVIADAKRDAVWDGKIGSLAKDKLRTGYAQAAITIADAIRNLGAAP